MSDAPRTLDLLELTVGRCGDSLWIAVRVDDLPPAGFDEVTEVAWAFEADQRSFVVKGYLRVALPYFELEEVTPGRRRALGEVAGTFDTYNDIIGIMVPLTLIGATTGSRISGADAFAGRDATYRLLANPITQTVDVLATGRSFAVPCWGRC